MRWAVMTIDSAAALLHVALQDLRAGKQDQADRLPRIAAHATDPELREILTREVAQVAAQVARIGDAGAGGSQNLWMAGILDDAERDTRQTQPGRLLDIALIGAIRKAKAAEIVSSETALMLAKAVGQQALRDVMTRNRAEEIASDRLLKARLMALSGTT